MKMEQTECSEKLAYKIQTPRNYPEENIHYHLSLFTFSVYEVSWTYLFSFWQHCIQLRYAAVFQL